MQKSLLDLGQIPVEELARLALREGARPRPIYGAHRWFARRFGSAFRALLTAAGTESDFWGAYYGNINWRGRVVLDPFCGGGTSIVEAQRLGARAVGVDVDPVACSISAFETRAADLPDLSPALAALKETVGDVLAPYYRTVNDAGDLERVLHFFWVQVVVCRSCGQRVEAHPHYRLAHEVGAETQWVFCRVCHAVEVLSHRVANGRGEQG